MLKPKILYILIVSGMAAAIVSIESSFSAQPFFKDAKSVEFSSYFYVYPPTPFAVKRAQKLGTEVEEKTEPSVPLTGYLIRPESEKPHPAVVLLHTCSGITDHEEYWTAQLVSWGYVVLVVDSLTPRGQKYICDGRVGSVSPWNRALDAFGAKKYLSNLPFVDPNRIAVVGASHGGMAVLEIIKQSTSENIPISPFRAAVAFYPLCGEPELLNTPTLVMIGGADKWTPAEQCIQYLQKLEQPHEMTLRVFPDAHHLFDHPGIDTEELGFIIRSNVDAAQQAIQMTREFLSEQL